MLYQTSERVSSLNQLILLKKWENALSQRLIFQCHPQIKIPLTGMIMNPDFDALRHSRQVPISLVIADFCYQNGVLSLFEYTHLMLTRPVRTAMCLGGIEGGTAKREGFEHHLICSGA